MINKHGLKRNNQGTADNLRKYHNLINQITTKRSSLLAYHSANFIR